MTDDEKTIIELARRDSRMVARVRDLSQEVDQLKRALAKAKRETGSGSSCNDTATTLAVENSSLHNLISRLEERCQYLQDQEIAARESTIKDLDAKLTASQSEVTSLKAQLKLELGYPNSPLALRSTIQSLEGRVKQQAERISQLEAELAAVRYQSAEAEAREQRTSKQLAAAQEQLADCTENRKQLAADNHRLREKVNDMISAINKNQ